MSGIFFIPWLAFIPQTLLLIVIGWVVIKRAFYALLQYTNDYMMDHLLLDYAGSMGSFQSIKTFDIVAIPMATIPFSFEEMEIVV